MRAASGQRRAVRPRTALVVEDDTPIRTTLSGLLEDNGFEVMTASSIARARYILFQSLHPVGVMVLDLSLDDGDGATLLAEMHERHDNCVPTVLLSASRLRVAVLAERYGIAHITKPFELEVLAAAILVAFETDVRPHRRVQSQP